MELNFYELLGINQTATEEELKAAYKKLAKKYHPDKHPGNPFYEEHFKKINSAYQTLSNSEKRKRYDLKLAYQAQKNVSKTSYSQRERNKRPATGKTYRKKIDPAQQKKFRKYAIISISCLVLFLLVTVWFYHYMNGVSARHHLAQAKIQEEKKFYTYALEEYSAAIHFDKNLHEAYEGRAGLRIKMFNDYAGAAEDYSKALSKENPDAELYFKRAKAYLKLKEYELGLTDLDSAISLRPTYDSLYFYRAEVNHFIRQDYKKAIQDYRKTIELTPTFTDAWLGRALSYQNSGEYKKSVDDFNRLISLEPENGSTFYYKAFSLLALKDSSGACNDFFQAERLNFQEARKAINTYCVGK